MSSEGEPDHRKPTVGSGSWPQASWTRSKELTEYRCAGQRAVRREDSAAPCWVPGELPPLLKTILQEYSATGLPPAYLPKTPPCQNGEP